MKKLLGLFSLLLAIVVGGCECSLHTHYYNDYGVCVCGNSISYKLTYSNEEYHSEDRSVINNEFYFYNFEAHGEEELEFHVIGDNVIFDRIEIRADGMIQTIASRKDASEKIYYFDTHAFYKDRTFHLKIRFEGEGSVKLVVKKPTE